MHLNIRKAQGTVNPQPATGAFWMAAGLCRSCDGPCRGVGTPDGPADGGLRPAAAQPQRAGFVLWVPLYTSQCLAPGKAY